LSTDCSTVAPHFSKELGAIDVADARKRAGGYEETTWCSMSSVRPVLRKNGRQRGLPKKNNRVEAWQKISKTVPKNCPIVSHLNLSETQKCARRPSGMARVRLWANRSKSVVACASGSRGVQKLIGCSCRWPIGEDWVPGRSGCQKAVCPF